MRFVEDDLRAADLNPATVVLLYLSTSLTRETDSETLAGAPARGAYRVAPVPVGLFGRRIARSRSRAPTCISGPCRNDRCRGAQTCPCRCRSAASSRSPRCLWGIWRGRREEAAGRQRPTPARRPALPSPGVRDAWLEILPGRREEAASGAAHKTADYARIGGMNRRRPPGVSDLFRLSGAVRRDPAVDTWMDEGAADLQSIAQTWFAHMRECGDDVVELVHDGCPVACVENAPFAYVDSFSSHVNVGFFRGAELSDPAGLLVGTGKRMRHVMLRPGDKVDSAALRALIAAAYLDIKTRLG